MAWHIFLPVTFGQVFEVVTLVIVVVLVFDVVVVAAVVELKDIDGLFSRVGLVLFTAGAEVLHFWFPHS